MKRADTFEEKEIRRRQLQYCLDDLLKDMPYSQITFTKLAEKLGWSRGNIYRYYRTMDEIVYELYANQATDIANALADCIEENRSEPDDVLAARMADVLISNVDGTIYLNIHSLVSKLNIGQDINDLHEEQMNLAGSRINELLCDRFGLTDKGSMSVFNGIWYHYLGFAPIINRVKGGMADQVISYYDNMESIREAIIDNILANFEYFSR